MLLQHKRIYKNMPIPVKKAVAVWSFNSSQKVKWSLAIFENDNFPSFLFCQRLFPICCFPGLPDVGAQQGAVAIWSCKFSQISGRIRGKIGNENSWNAKEVLVPKWSNSIVVFIYSKNYLFADKTISRLWYRLKCGNNNSSRFPWVWPVRWVFCLKNCEVFFDREFFQAWVFRKG